MDQFKPGDEIEHNLMPGFARVMDGTGNDDFDVMPDPLPRNWDDDWGTNRDLASIPGGAPEAPVTWTCTRVQLIEALRTMYATGPSLDMLGEWADKILSHLPVAEAPEPPAVVPAQPGGQLW